MHAVTASICTLRRKCILIFHVWSYSLGLAEVQFKYQVPMFGPLLFFWFWLGGSAYMGKDQIYNLELKIKKSCIKISVSYQNPSYQWEETCPQSFWIYWQRFLSVNSCTLFTWWRYLNFEFWLLLRKACFKTELTEPSVSMIFRVESTQIQPFYSRVKDTCQQWDYYIIVKLNSRV